MATLYNQVTPQRVLIWCVTAAGFILAPTLAYFVCILGWKWSLIVGGVTLIVAWAFIARDRWWVPLPAAVMFGGQFYYGFKIPVYEMALLICLFPLALALATRWQGAIPGRTKIPVCIFLMTFYILMHWVGSLVYNKLEGLGGVANVTRSYMSAFWPFILFYSYYFFGNSKYLKLAFNITYVFCLLRVALAVIANFNPGLMYIPGINFVLPSSETDLRASCPPLFELGICYIYMYRGIWTRFFHSVVCLSCFYFITLGGGRVSIVLILLIVLYVAVISRLYLMVLIFSILVGSGMIVLNSHPQVLDHMPYMVQRSLSGLILYDAGIDIQESIGASDDWHHGLQAAGKKRWLHSMPSILIGNGIRPIDPSFLSNRGDIEDFLAAAAASSHYESSLWTTLATFGLVGLLLYLNIFYFLLRETLPLLWKEKIHNYETSFAFLASSSIFIWITLSYIAGSFPSTEIMMGLFAKTLHDDRLLQDKKTTLQGLTTSTDNVATHWG